MKTSCSFETFKDCFQEFIRPLSVWQMSMFIHGLAALLFDIWQLLTSAHSIFVLASCFSIALGILGLLGKDLTDVFVKNLLAGLVGIILLFAFLGLVYSIPGKGPANEDYMFAAWVGLFSMVYSFVASVITVPMVWACKQLLWWLSPGRMMKGVRYGV